MSWPRAFGFKWNPRTWSRCTREAARTSAFKLELRRFNLLDMRCKERKKQYLRSRKWKGPILREVVDTVGSSTIMKGRSNWRIRPDADAS